VTVFWHEIRRALGQLRRSTAFTVLAVVILGFGLGATLYMFTVVKAYVLTPLPYPAAERIMHLGRVNPLDGLDHVRVPPHDYLEWRKAQQSFAALAASLHQLCRTFGHRLAGARERRVRHAIGIRRRAEQGAHRPHAAAARPSDGSVALRMRTTS